jgi:hypothetical protein
MKASDLKIGDRIRILELPGKDVAEYYLHLDTRRIYKKLILRGTSLRISRIDEYGAPWYECRFRRKNGAWEFHTLAVFESDRNWVKVKARRTPKSKPVRRDK